MLQYIYKAEECGLNEWPSGTLRLDFETTDDPSQADVIVYPGALHELRKDDFHRLPYFDKYERKIVAFHCADHEDLYSTQAVIIRCNTRDWYLTEDPRTISWPWPVENFEECISVPEGGFRHDVSFQGWHWSDVRKESIQSCVDTPELRNDFATYPDFTGYLPPGDELTRRRSEFRRSMKESRVALCPESIPGVFPYRFFEAMSAGRVPVLVGSNYVLPFDKEIPYETFSLMIPRHHASQAGPLIKRLLCEFTDDELIEKGKWARAYFMEYLYRDYWVRLMTKAVEKAMS